VTDKSFRRALKPFKSKRRYRRDLGRGIGYLSWLYVPTDPGKMDTRCVMHPDARWLKCGTIRGHAGKFHGGRQNLFICFGYFCRGCYGNTCPFCGKQMKVKQRRRSRAGG
jgi:hypothetical protein